MEVNGPTVGFTYKDYRDSSKKKVAVLNGTEFLRRFATHILPSGFVRIRHYGFLASRNKPTELSIAKEELGQPRWEQVKCDWQELAKEKLNYDLAQCPDCKKQGIVMVKILLPQRGPPHCFPVA